MWLSLDMFGSCGHVSQKVLYRAREFRVPGTATTPSGLGARRDDPAAKQLSERPCSLQPEE